MNDKIMEAAGFSKEVNRVKAGHCPTCNREMESNEFRNEISAKEFQISGMCQKCQDSFFGAD